MDHRQPVFYFMNLEDERAGLLFHCLLKRSKSRNTWGRSPHSSPPPFVKGLIELPNNTFLASGESFGPICVLEELRQKGTCRHQKFYICCLRNFTNVNLRCSVTGWLASCADIEGLMAVIIPAIGFGKADEQFSLFWVLSLWTWNYHWNHLFIV